MLNSSDYAKNYASTICKSLQGSGANRGILGYTMQNLACANRQKLLKDLTSQKSKTWCLHNNIWKIKTKTKRSTQINAVKAYRRMPHPPKGHKSYFTDQVKTRPFPGPLSLLSVSY